LPRAQPVHAAYRQREQCTKQRDCRVQKYQWVHPQKPLADELKKLTFEYIKHDFKYSILDIFKSTVDDQIILARESWWKSVLQTRKFGYNNN